jgi:hypothetical protein
MPETSVSTTADPLVKLEPGGVAPIISYNVPEPTTYSGRNFIDLQFPASYFVVGTNAATTLTGGSTAEVMMADADGGPLEPYRTLATHSLAAAVGVDPEEVELMARQGMRLQVYRSMSGALRSTWVEANLAPHPGTEPGARAVRAVYANGETEPAEIQVAITSPANNATISGPYTGATLQVQGTVWSNRTIGDVSVRIGSGSFQTATRSGGTWTFTTTLTAPGWTSVTARARTSGGIISDDTISVNVALAPPPDTVPPAVGITAPPNGGSLSGPSTGVTVTVAGTAADPSGIQTVDVRVDTGAYQQATPKAPGDWSTWTRPVTLTIGNHTISARARDNAGNLSEQTIAVSATLAPPADTTGPSLTISSPANGASISGPYSGATITVTGTASDPSGVSKVELRLGQSPVWVDAQPKAPNDWSQWTGSLLAKDPGSYLITAKATDNAGNVTQLSVTVNVTLIPDVVNRLNRLILVESYRLSSYLGRYGAGRTLKTFSLLPGEKTKISVKTYTKTETDAKNASSVLDSFTNESADDFEKSMADEQSNKKNYDESFNYKVGVEAKASWGWGSASAAGQVSGGTNAAREEFAKNITNAVQKHVSKASAKREVQVNTSYEVKTQTGEETSIEREIANINVGATLNFVFRQMNQEFITLLHLVDVRVGYFKVDTVNGVERYTYREATLPELDALLRDVIVDARRQEVRATILYQLSNIFDYKDRQHVFVEEEPLRDRDGKIVPYSSYLRVRKDYTSNYVDEASGTQIKVPGIIMAANSSVLRTEGIIVEALLGHGDGLDAYSHGLQEEAVRARMVENAGAELEQTISKFALKIVQTNDVELANLYKQLFLSHSGGNSTGGTSSTPALVADMRESGAATENVQLPAAEPDAPETTAARGKRAKHKAARARS